MGYDYEECLLCYIHGGNELAERRKLVCLQCMYTFTKNKERSVGVINEGLRGHVEGGPCECSVCKQESMIHFLCTFCEECIQANKMD